MSRPEIGEVPVGPTLPTWALQRVGSYREYTGRGANVVRKAARDPYASRNVREVFMEIGGLSVRVPR